MSRCAVSALLMHILEVFYLWKWEDSRNVLNKNICVLVIKTYKWGLAKVRIFFCLRVNQESVLKLSSRVQENHCSFLGFFWNIHAPIKPSMPPLCPLCLKKQTKKNMLRTSNPWRQSVEGPLVVIITGTFPVPAFWGFHSDWLESLLLFSSDTWQRPADKMRKRRRKVDSDKDVQALLF